MAKNARTTTAWTMDEAVEQLTKISSGRDSDLDLRRRLRLGRTDAELEVLASMLVEAEANGSREQGWLLTRLSQEDLDGAKRARQAGEPIPAMPFMEAMKRRNEKMATTPGSTKAGTKRAGKANAVQFTHDGKPIAVSQNKLSSVAWFYTKPLGDHGGRMSTSQLKALLASEGVDDPFTPGWSVKLDNGITIGAIVFSGAAAPKLTVVKDRSREALADGSIAKAVAKKTVAKKTAKKTPVKQTAKQRTRAAAAKKTPAKRPAAKKATAPKKATAKKGTASAPLERPMAPRKAMAAKA